MASDLPLSKFPAYKQATPAVGSCVESWLTTLSRSFGCSDNPATCLCTDADKSQRAATSIRSCARYYDSSNMSTATKLWASYCSVNAGISARDELLMQDFQPYISGGNSVQYCATSITDAQKTTLACTNYPYASCLCNASEGNFGKMEAEFSSCAFNSDVRPTALAVWSAWCSVNIQTPGIRQIETPQRTLAGAESSVSTASPGSGSGGSSGTAASSTGTGQTTGSSDTPSSSSNSTLNPAAYIVPAILGTLVLMAIAFWIWHRRRTGRSRQISHPSHFRSTETRRAYSPTQTSTVAPSSYNEWEYVNRTRNIDEVRPEESQTHVGMAESYVGHNVPSLVSTQPASTMNGYGNRPRYA